MATTTTHAPGTFCWFELATRDEAAAKNFYTKLFGWEIDEQPAGPPGQIYTILKLAGREAAALHGMAPEHYPAQVPSHWLAYVAVESTDATAEKVKAAGGQVVAGPFDVMEHGRMAVCVDPLGTTFAVWQANKMPGAGVIGEPGSFGWCQLNVPAGGQKRAQDFYTAALGWTFREDPMPMGENYTTWLGEGGAKGGMMAMPGGVQAPSHWLIYFSVADVDATAAKAKELGGTTLVPPMDIPGIGRFAVIADVQGAAFAVVKFSMPM